MKKLFGVVLVIFTLLIFAGCNASDLQEKNDWQKKNGEVSPPFKIINVTYDNYNHLVQRILYNEEIKKTYIIDYFYQYNNGIWVCVETEMTVLDVEGNVVTEENVDNN